MSKFELKYFIIGLSLLIIVTIIVLNSDSSIGKVSFTNQGFVIRQENTSITNKNIVINTNKTKYNVTNQTENISTHQNIETQTSNIKLINKKNSTITSNYDTKTDLRKRITEFDNHSNTYTYKIYQNKNYNNQQKNEYKDYYNQIPTTNKSLNNLANTINNKKAQSALQPHEKDKKYIYKNISWNEWKSNFINKFLDDSLTIKSLDEYGIGTWFYYSFVVTNTGEIEDIKVKSFYLKEQDKIEIRNLIRNYAHKDVTVFPANSQRLKAKVDAVVVLGNSESKSKPSDFHDNEKIKIEY